MLVITHVKQIFSEPGILESDLAQDPRGCWEGSGIKVILDSIELTEIEEIVEVCRRGKRRRRIPKLDLPLPGPMPGGAK
jgi:hypothetical protein